MNRLYPSCYTYTHTLHTLNTHPCGYRSFFVAVLCLLLLLLCYACVARSIHTFFFLHGFLFKIGKKFSLDWDAVGTMLPHINFYTVFLYSIFSQLAAGLSPAHSTLGHSSAPAIATFCQVVFNPSPLIFFGVFNPVYSDVPVLLFFLGEPSPCSLGRPNLRQPHQHVSSGWSTHCDHDTGQAVSIR